MYSYSSELNGQTIYAYFGVNDEINSPSPDSKKTIEKEFNDTIMFDNSLETFKWNKTNEVLPENSKNEENSKTAKIVEHDLCIISTNPESSISNSSKKGFCDTNMFDNALENSNWTNPNEVENSKNEEISNTPKNVENDSSINFTNPGSLVSIDSKRELCETNSDTSGEKWKDLKELIIIQQPKKEDLFNLSLSNEQNIRKISSSDPRPSRRLPMRQSSIKTSFFKDPCSCFCKHFEVEMASFQSNSSLFSSVVTITRQ